ncbi:MAG: hypothetical protein Q4B77_05455 [Coriobacteriaceae bacterium]|nr:hypothetical protein [Coriobacteriaceae bacterium]
MSDQNLSVSRRVLLTTTALLASSALFTTVEAHASGSDFSGLVPDGYTLLCKDGTISAYHSGSVILYVSDSGKTLRFEQTGPQAYLLTGEDGVAHVVLADSYGCTTLDGKPLADIIYRRENGDPVTYACVLMSTSKMTVEQAAMPTQLVGSILACFGNVPAQVAMTIANFAFNWTVTQHRNMWLTMEHWYCDTPKMITRKVWTLYEDEACTKFVKSWTSEAPVGVEV